MKLYKTILKLSIFIVVVTVLYSSVQISSAEAPTMTKEQVYNFKMDTWLNKLSKAESGNDSKLVFLDRNNKYSYSCLQFQKETWNTYSKKFGIQGDIMDCTKQKQLAVLMVQSNYNLWRSWFTSCAIKGVGKPPRLDES